MTPDEIYTESFRIIEAEAKGHRYDPTEWPIVRRMIHASGDLDYLRSTVFARGAAAEGVEALRGGVPIVTDVMMVLAGISKPHASALGVTLRCFLDDPDVRERAAATGLTRSACAMEKAMDEVGDAVYVVGNAPTALLALSEAAREGRLRPRLLVAMPVGFVSVVESKERALELPETPVVAVRGRKGGSAVAAAAVNAMLRLAAGESSP
jgi:precorrin-8X/cobalt-precorrin-8 methylmutase